MNGKKGEKIKIVKVDTEYLKELQKIDSRVPKKNNRPYLFLKLKIKDKNNDISYCIPIFSLKNKKPKENITYSIKDQNKVISNLMINNMIPVPKNKITEIRVENLDKVDKNLFIKQSSYIKKDFPKILEKAQNFYKQMKTSKSKYLLRLACDFTRLEGVYRKHENYNKKIITKSRRRDKDFER